MKAFFEKNRYPLILILIYAAAELLVNPLGEFPLNDDWSYSKSVLMLHRDGHYYIGDWGSMMLAGQIVWGLLFVKALGFSFFVLRLSTMVSFIIGLVTLYKLALALTQNKTAALASALTLLFNPFCFNLSNTFMTDVNFNTWMLLTFYFAYVFFSRGGVIYFVLVILMSLVMALTRQFGLVLPFCFALSCLLLRERRLLYFSLALAGAGLVLIIFKWYDAYLIRTLPDYSGYRSFSTVSITQNNFVYEVLGRFAERYKSMLLYMLMYSSPLCVVFYPALVKKTGWLRLLMIAVLNALVLLPVLDMKDVSFGNIFTNMSLGPETFYSGPISAEQAHTYAPWFATVAGIAALVLSLLSAVFFSASVYVFVTQKAKVVSSVPRAFVVMLIAFALLYVALICVTVSYFDRYLIPIITLVLLLAVIFSSDQIKNLWSALPVLILFAYVSVAGTRDYFTVNRIKWEAVEQVKAEKNIETEKINGGFEVSCWDDGRPSWWRDYTTLNGYDYVLTYNKPEHFSQFREFEFARCFPFKKDKIFIFVRDSL